MNSQDIESVLTELGYVLDDRGDYWQTNAVYRGGDNRTAVQIYKDTGVWKDYVQETGFLPLQALIEKSCEDLSKKDLDNILKNFNSITPATTQTKQQKYTTEEIYTEEELEKLLSHEKFSLIDIKGLKFNPFFNKWKKSNDLSVNYIISSLKN